MLAVCLIAAGQQHAYLPDFIARFDDGRGDDDLLNTWIVRRTVEAVLVWCSQTAVEPVIREAAALAATFLRRSIEERRTQLRDEQGCCSMRLTRSKTPPSAAAGASLGWS